MSNTTLRFVVLFILLVLLQVWLFGQIHLWGVATPLAYIYFILKLPTGINSNVLLLLSALLGLVVDFFTGTLGLHMLACTVAGFARIFLVKLFAPRDVHESMEPSSASFGRGYFFRYTLLFTFIHHLTLYSVESFSVFDPLRLVLRIAGSMVLTIIIILAFERIKLRPATDK